MNTLVSKMNWMVLALLAVSLTAAAQQSAPAPQNPQPAAATQPAQAQASPTQAGQAAANLGPPTTMDQVVDRVIMREKELIKFLSPRTPVVETYL